jgi:hypothetical protein
MEEEPRLIDYVMAIVPSLIVVINSISILSYALYAKNSPIKEQNSPIFSTLLSAVILITSIVALLYDYHEDFELIKILFKIIIRINLVQLAICVAFIVYLKNNIDQYNTYFVFLYCITIPMLFLAIVPFISGIRPLIRNHETQYLLGNVVNPRR